MLQNLYYLGIAIIVVLGVPLLLNYLIGYYLIISRTRLPQRFIEFPESDFALDDLLRIRSQIDEFVQATRQGSQAEIQISQAELNSLKNEGRIFSKYRPGKYTHYEIGETYIIERQLEWPSAIGKAACFTRIRHLRPVADQVAQIEESLIEENNRTCNSSYLSSLIDSRFIHLIFGIPILFPGSDQAIANSDFQLVSIPSNLTSLRKAVSSITEIKIHDRHLVLIAASQAGEVVG
jgi:low affinity Fe/Cu permease